MRKKNELGGVYVFNSEESIAAGLPGTIVQPENSNTNRWIKMKDAKWYADYIISTQEEIRSYLPGVDAEKISQVAIILYTGASHPGAKGELLADNIQLYSIERQ